MKSLYILFLNSDTSPVSGNDRTSSYRSAGFFLLYLLAETWIFCRILFLFTAGCCTWSWICLPAFTFLLVFFVAGFRTVAVLPGLLLIHRPPLRDHQWSFFECVQLLLGLGPERGAVLAERSVGGLEFERTDTGPWRVANCMLRLFSFLLLDALGGA